MKMLLRLRLISSLIVTVALIGNVLTAENISKKITIDMFSGKPNPVITLTDSSSAALIDNRIGHYLIISRPSDSNAPQPLSNLGYRGILVNYIQESVADRIYASNGSVSFDMGNRESRFFDYNSEFEKMVLRFLKRAASVSPEIDSEKILNLIPDFLSKEYTETGFFTLEENGLFFSNSEYLDFSLLGSGYHYLSKVQDTSFISDLTITRGSGVNFILQSSYGLIDADSLPGLPPVTSTTMAGNYTSLLDVYKNVLFLSEKNPPESGYQQKLILTDNLKTGRLFIVKTSEGGYVALIFAGSYIGAVNRLHFYYYFTTNNIFSPGSTGTMASPNSKGSVTVTTTYRCPLQHSLMVNLKGQKIINESAVLKKKLPGQKIIRNKLIEK